MKIWTYWEGPRWPHIDLCFGSMKKCLGEDITILNPDTLKDLGILDLITPRHKEIKEIGPRTDFYRAALLWKYGGLWIDADTVILDADKLRALLSYVDISDLVYMMWSTEPCRVITGYIGAKQKSKIIKDWLDIANKCIEATPDMNISWWLKLGEQCLTPALQGARGVIIHQLPLSTFLPIDLDHGGCLRFVGTTNWRDYVTKDTVAFGLNHSWLVANHPDLMRSWPVDSPILIHKLFNYAEGAL